MLEDKIKYIEKLTGLMLFDRWLITSVDIYIGVSYSAIYFYIHDNTFNIDTRYTRIIDGYSKNIIFTQIIWYSCENKLNITITNRENLINNDNNIIIWSLYGK